jgi:hypothetical protein
MPIRQRMSILRQMTYSRPPDHAQYQRNNRNDQQDMNQPTRTIYKKAKYPADDQDNCNEIQ